MSGSTRQEQANLVYDNLRLRTQPIAVKFLENTDFPEKTRRPSQVFGKRITICQGVTMARVYGWPVGLGREDLICVPAMIAFGFTPASDQKAVMKKCFATSRCHAIWIPQRLNQIRCLFWIKPRTRVYIWSRLPKSALDPDTITIIWQPGPDHAAGPGIGSIWKVRVLPGTSVAK